MNARLAAASGLLVAVSATGCVPDVEMRIRNPLVARRVDPNRIVKNHDWGLGNSGLPRGTIRDEAVLTEASKAQICFAVMMRTFTQLDFDKVEARLSSPKQPRLDQPTAVTPEQVEYQQIPGRIPQQRENGSETYCASRDSNNICTSWRTRPVYITIWVPGLLDVYTNRAQLCFANDHFFTRATPQFTLALSVPTGQMGAFFAPETKDEDFTWGFGAADADGQANRGQESEADAADGQEPAPRAVKKKRAPAPAAAQDDTGDDSAAPPPPAPKKRAAAAPVQDDSGDDSAPPPPPPSKKTTKKKARPVQNDD